MKHTKPLTKKPQMMQSGLEALVDFKVTLVDQIIEFFFNRALF